MFKTMVLVSVISLMLLISYSEASPPPRRPTPRTPAVPRPTPRTPAVPRPAPRTPAVPHPAPHTSVSPPPPPPPPVQKPVMYTLALQWPKSLCEVVTCNPSIKRPLPDDFTLHGLWPQMPPAFKYPCTGEDFSGSKIKVIAGLDRWMPSFTKNTNDFRADEWNVHGKCSGMDQIEYFRDAVTLTKQYATDVLESMRSAVIVPGSRTSAARIEDAVFNKLTKKTRLICARKNDNEPLYFKEIRLCMDLNYQLIDCYPKNQGCGDEKLPVINFP